MSRTKAWLIGLAIVVSAVFVWQGIANFDQWAAFVGGLMGSA